MNVIRRPIHPEIKVIDAARGTVEYIASDESIDSYGEVVCARGVDFSRFQKNAPFVDSHNYQSVDCLLGKVTDYKAARGQVVETVQWAIDVPQNFLAQKGFAMTQAGYLKAVSIGFIPLQVARRSDPHDEWAEACEDLGMGDLEDSINCIHQKWMQIELSACCIGANMNAVARGYKAGLLSDADLETLFKISHESKPRETAPASFVPPDEAAARQAAQDDFLWKFQMALSKIKL